MRSAVGTGGTWSEGNGRLRLGTNPLVAAGADAGHDKARLGQGTWARAMDGSRQGGLGGWSKEMNEDECRTPHSFL